MQRRMCACSGTCALSPGSWSLLELGDAERPPCSLASFLAFFFSFLRRFFSCARPLQSCHGSAAGDVLCRHMTAPHVRDIVWMRQAATTACRWHAIRQHEPSFPAFPASCAPRPSRSPLAERPLAARPRPLPTQSLAAHRPGLGVAAAARPHLVPDAAAI